MNKKVILSVTNDLVSDQRVHKVCTSLQKWGFDVLLVGRLRRKSPALEKRSYCVKRMNLLFDTGPFFYMEYNIRLFFFLLFHRADILVANDLDTLCANYIASKITGRKLAYDSHEYFTEVPELVLRKFTQSIWRAIEQWIFPKLQFVYTVNDSIANAYFTTYKIKPAVIRNFPVKVDETIITRSKTDLLLPKDKKIILYQGAVNIDRGLPEVIEAMQFVNNAVLLIIGDGDILNELKAKIAQLKLNEKVIFFNRVPFEMLKQYTLHADIGISLEKDTNLNYRFTLPNKLFDYVHAGVPVLASPLDEIKKIFSAFSIGLLIDSHAPQHIADKINLMLSDLDKRKVWRENCLAASKEYCWQHEENVLKRIYNSINL